MRDNFLGLKVLAARSNELTGQGRKIVLQKRGEVGPKRI